MSGNVYLSGSHYQGPLLGSNRAVGGALADAPLELASRPDWFVYENDFTQIEQDYLATTDWSLTQVSAGGSASILAATGASETGILRLDCPANLDGPIVQLDGSAAAGLSPLGFTPSASSATALPSECYFAARFAIQDVSAQGTFVGLAELNSQTAVIATPTGGITSDTHCGFHTDSSGTLIFTAAGADDTAAVTVADCLITDLTDGDYVEVAMRLIGTTTAEGYVREVNTAYNEPWRKVGTLTTAAAWANQMLITFANLGGGTGDDLDIDYVGMAVRRNLVRR